jgi:hypothetical protein
MDSKDSLSGITEIVHVSSGNFTDFDDKVNEYLMDGYRLLHIGTETDPDSVREGKPAHNTVAVLGRGYEPK